MKILRLKKIFLNIFTDHSNIFLNEMIETGLIVKRGTLWEGKSWGGNVSEPEKEG